MTDTETLRFKLRRQLVEGLVATGQIPQGENFDSIDTMSRYLVVQRHNTIDDVFWITFDDMDSAETYAGDELAEEWLTETIVDLNHGKLYDVLFRSTAEAVNERMIATCSKCGDVLPGPISDHNDGDQCRDCLNEEATSDAVLGKAFRLLYTKWFPEGDMPASSSDQVQSVLDIFNANGHPVS